MRLAALVALAVLVLAACGSGEDDPRPRAAPPATTTEETAAETQPGGWASEQELAWLRKVGRWSTRFNREVTDLQVWAADPATQERLDSPDDALVTELERLVAPIRACRESFDREVCYGPTGRVQRGANRMREACDGNREFADHLVI